MVTEPVMLFEMNTFMEFKAAVLIDCGRFDVATFTTKTTTTKKTTKV